MTLEPGATTGEATGRDYDEDQIDSNWRPACRRRYAELPSGLLCLEYLTSRRASRAAVIPSPIMSYDFSIADVERIAALAHPERTAEEKQLITHVSSLPSWSMPSKSRP